MSNLNIEHKPIGNTGLFLPPIVFGTSALGNLYVALEDEAKLAIVKECISHVPHPVVFDSAGKYGAGLALEKLGQCLEKAGIEPSQVIISNKLGWKRIPLCTPEPTFEPGVWRDIKHDAVQDISYNGILTCFEQGNQLLGGKYTPSLLSVHDPDEYLAGAFDASDRKKRFNDILEAYRALSDLKKQGKVKAIGVGAKKWQVIQEIAQWVELDWVMFANSMTILNHPTDLLEFMSQLNKKGIAIINSAVFHAGFLIGGDYFDYKLIKPDSPENKAKFEWREKFFALCQRHSVLPAAACVAFGMTVPGVVSIALNTSKAHHVKGNVESVITTVPSAFWEEMIENNLISKSYPYLFT